MINIKILIKGALVTLGTRLKVPILATFDDLGHFSSCLFSHKPSGFISDFNSDNLAKFREVSMPISCISKNRVFRDFGL